MQEQAWFYLGEDGERQGPLEATDLVDMCVDGIVTYDTPVWCKSLGDWQQFEQVEALCWLAQEATPSEEALIWHVLDMDGGSVGPLSIAQMRALLSDGSVSVESPVWSAGLGEWHRMCDVSMLRALHSG